MGSTSRRLGWALVGLLLVFALGHAIYRGPVSLRGNIRLYDFGMYFASSRAWLLGLNPYDKSVLGPMWTSGGGAAEGMLQIYWISVLPPGAYALMAPLAALPVHAAVPLWIAICLALIALMLDSTMALAKWTRSPGARLGRWLFISAALASAPVQALLMLGNGSVIAVSFILASLERAHRGHQALAGILLGVASSVKPQLAAPFFLWFAFFQRWRGLAWAMAVLLALNAIAILPMQLQGHDWARNWAANIRSTGEPGMNDDPTSSGPWRHQMVHLAAWLFTITDDARLVSAISWALCLALAASFVAMLSRTPPRQSLLLPLAALAALTLLPVYHKSYDDALLLVALAWAMREAAVGPMRRCALATLVLLLPFLLPFDLIPQFARHTRALDAIADHVVWRSLLYPHHAVATLAVGLCLVVTMWLNLRRLRPARASEPLPVEVTAAPARAADPLEISEEPAAV